MTRALLHWVLPVWVAYTVVFVAWWAYRLTIGGGLDSPGEAVGMVIGGIGCILGLVLGWQVRRGSPAS